MPWLEAIEAVREFVDRGGQVLLAIGAVTFLMWTLILERVWYFRRVAPRRMKRAYDEWRQRRERDSWGADKIRSQLISEVRMDMGESLIMIKTLVALCPLLGLLGTVTGMIEVFDVMAVSGSGNTRAMAAGVSKATIPTMAGMVAALSGLMLSVQFERFAQQRTARVADQLTRD
jgi:biopolymer transport protein ExbB